MFKAADAYAEGQAGADSEGKSRERSRLLYELNATMERLSIRLSGCAHHKLDACVLSPSRPHWRTQQNEASSLAVPLSAGD